MIAAFGTLAFLATLWLLVMLGAAILEESGAKITAALKRKPKQSPAYVAPVRLRKYPRAVKPIRASVQWRAAA
jgi:hypothetical protein